MQQDALLQSLKAWSSGALERAEALLSGDRLFDLRAEASTLRGAARGVKQSWYAVEVTLTSDGAAVTSGRCTCPAGADGRCKHVAAVALAWAREPRRFAVLDGIEARLRHRSYEELISMVAQMVRSHPELEALTLGPVPGGHREAPSITRWRTQADDVFRRHGAAWTNVAALTRELDAMLALGADFERQGERAHAAALHEGLALSVVGNARRYPWPDVRARFHELVAKCADRLPGRPSVKRALAELDAMPVPPPRRARKAANDNAA
ncbi:MAG: hypothetical protein R3A52_24020 [Polyangiales bacterium]